MKRELEALVWERAESICEYCQFPADCTMLPFEVDHIIATKHHGKTESDNLV